MKKFLKKNMKVIVFSIISSIITGSAVYATVINSIDVAYDNSNSTLEATTVQGAIDELSTKANNSSSGFKDRKGCEYKCSNGFYAEYYNGTMIGCRYDGSYGYAVCNGGSSGGSSLYMCQTSGGGILYNKCTTSLGYSNSGVSGGGCPSSYTCP